MKKFIAVIGRPGDDLVSYVTKVRENESEVLDAISDLLWDGYELRFISTPETIEADCQRHNVRLKRHKEDTDEWLNSISI